MKTTILYATKLLAAAGMAVGLSACIADLEEYNPSGFTADNVFASEEGHTGLVNLCYSQLRKEFYGRENPVGLAMAGTDIWTDSPGRDGYFPTGQYGTKLNSSNEGLMKNCWERLYIPINNCNAAIERGATAAYGSEELRASRIAEARFLRAFYYWHIVEQWGNVVLRMEETKEVVKTAQRSPVRDFYER
ncbi:MAG: RagB/SusD family nutrient uptake outer membrane protein, partial [Prevotellaceae bacterium]|nr:RagB/SusD family nutrient uptake outer membrane protein [Prevotellaceae bacterium]